MVHFYDFNVYPNASLYSQCDFNVIFNARSTIMCRRVSTKNGTAVGFVPASAFSIHRFLTEPNDPFLLTNAGLRLLHLQQKDHNSDAAVRQNPLKAKENAPFGKLIRGLSLKNALISWNL